MDDGKESRVASFLIPKTIQNGIRGCFISHPQKFSYIRQFEPCALCTSVCNQQEGSACTHEYPVFFFLKRGQGAMGNTYIMCVYLTILFTKSSVPDDDVFPYGRFCSRTFLQQNAVSQTDKQTGLSELIYQISYQWLLYWLIFYYRLLRVIVLVVILLLVTSGYSIGGYSIIGY